MCAVSWRRTAAGAEEIAKLLPELKGWEVRESSTTSRRVTASQTFASRLTFVNRVGTLRKSRVIIRISVLAGDIAEIKIWTHKINGLTESDFILAAKIDKL